MIKVLITFVTLVLMSTQLSASPVDTYVFQSEVDKIRFQELTKELRCPKCQNQNLADSNSPIAADLRREVYNLLEQNKSDMEIVDFMVDRYGEFVLYRPKVNSITYILWFGPAVLVIGGIIVVFMIVRRKPKKKEEVSEAALSAEQKQKLDQILKDK